MRYIISYTLNILFHSEAKITLFYLFLFAFIRFHPLLFVITCWITGCHWLSLSISLVVSLVVTRCLFVVARWHSLSFVVNRCHSLYHTLPLVVPHVVTCWHSLLFIVTRCHSLSVLLLLVLYLMLTLPSFKPLVVTSCYSLSLDVPLVCLFINDPKILKKVFKNSTRHANTTS